MPLTLQTLLCGMTPLHDAHPPHVHQQMAAQGQAHTWRSTLDELRAALASPMPHGLAVQEAIAHLPPIEAEADPEGLRAELAG